MPPDFADPSNIDRPREREYLGRSALRQSASARGPERTGPGAQQYWCSPPRDAANVIANAKVGMR